MTKEFTIKTVQDFRDLQDHVNRVLYNHVVKNLDFKAFDVKIEEHKEKRTNLQNAYYWGVVSSIVEFLKYQENCTIIKMGVACKWQKEDVDIVNKVKFGIESTSKLSRKEFCDLMENTFAFWIEKTKGKWKPLETAESYFNSLEFNNKKEEENE